MHTTLLLALGTTLAVGPVEPVRVVPPAIAKDGAACQPLSRHATGREKPRARKLVDAPPADLHLAVDRRVNGCPAPALAGAPQR